MSIFRCGKCGCIENTATSHYWSQKYPVGDGEVAVPLCSECDPEIGKWHGRFPKEPADGYQIGEDGFLYPLGDKPRHTKIVGVVPGEFKAFPSTRMEFPEGFGACDEDEDSES